MRFNSYVYTPITSIEKEAYALEISIEKLNRQRGFLFTTLKNLKRKNAVTSELLKENCIVSQFKIEDPCVEKLEEELKKVNKDYYKILEKADKKWKSLREVSKR